MANPAGHSKERKKPTARRGSRQAFMFLGPVIAMCVFGAYVGLTTTEEARARYIWAVKDGLVFAVAPIFVAVVLVVVIRLLMRVLRSPSNLDFEVGASEGDTVTKPATDHKAEDPS